MGLMWPCERHQGNLWLLPRSFGLLAHHVGTRHNARGVLRMRIGFTCQWDTGAVLVLAVFNSHVLSRMGAFYHGCPV